MRWNGEQKEEEYERKNEQRIKETDGMLKMWLHIPPFLESLSAVYGEKKKYMKWRKEWNK